MPTVIRGSSGGNVITDSTYTPGMVIQYQSTQSNSFLSVGGTTPWDDTIPQSGEGTEVFAVSITPNHLIYSMEDQSWNSSMRDALLEGYSMKINNK